MVVMGLLLLLLGAVVILVGVLTADTTGTGTGIGVEVLEPNALPRYELKAKRVFDHRPQAHRWQVGSN